MLALSGCENFGLDIFPTSLQNANGRINLASRVHAEDGATLKSVVEIERLSSSSSGSTYLFALCNTDLGMRLIVLDPDSLATKAYLNDSWLSSRLGVDASGNFVSGSVKIDPSSLSVSGTVASSSAFLLPVTVALTSVNLVLSGSSGTLTAKTYDTNWADDSSSILGLTNLSLSVTGSSSSYALVDAAVTSDGVRLLFRDDSEAGLALSLSPSSLPGASGSLASLASSSTSLSSLESSEVFLTSDGIIVPSSGNSQSRLLRYGYGAGTEIDSRLFSRDGIEALSFDYMGKVWYYYDSYAGLLYAMRAWW